MAIHSEAMTKCSFEWYLQWEEALQQVQDAVPGRLFNSSDLIALELSVTEKSLFGASQVLN